MAKAKPRRLGKGLAGLISGGSAKKTATGTSPASKTSSSSAPSSPKAMEAVPTVATAKEATSISPDFQEIPVGKIDANPYQPRKDFEESQLADLAESIQSEGLIQPIVVRKVGDRYQTIAGERRLRAFKMLKLGKIPARVIEVGDASSASMALIENLQRENLNPIEESMGYASLIRDFDLTQEQVADRVGKGRATIANSLRLLSLPEEIRGYLASGLLSTGHAKVLLGVENKQEQTILARRIIEQGVSVRGAEALIQSLRKTGAAKPSSSREVPPDEQAAIEDIEKRMRSFLNTNVQLKHAPKKGRITIEYSGNDDLQRILEKIGLEE